MSAHVLCKIISNLENVSRVIHECDAQVLKVILTTPSHPTMSRTSYDRYVFIEYCVMWTTQHHSQISHRLLARRPTLPSWYA